MRALLSGSASRQTRAEELALPRPSALLCRCFGWWVHHYLRKHFHAVRLARGSRPDLPADLPLLVVLNHPSWWDPLIGMVLAGLFPERTHYVPMAAQALARYRLFSKLGFYGVERGSLRGARTFLRMTTALLSQPRSAVWITAQGEFVDPRVRPPRLRSGVGHVARQLRRGIIVPLALEYPFWEGRLPEALARFGEPIRIVADHHLSVAQWTERIETSLAITQDALMSEAVGHTGAAFESLVVGHAGVGGIYDAWRRLRAWLHGQRFDPEHPVAEDLS